MSVEMKKIYEIAEEWIKTRSVDLRYRHCVSIIHEEGTVLFFKNAFIVKYFDPDHSDWGDCEFPGEWIMVFTEHHGLHVYPVDDLVYFQEFQPVESERNYPSIEEMIRYEHQHQPQRLDCGELLPSWNPDDLSAELKERYEIRPTGDVGFDSGRLRYFVKCRECNEVLHSNTTGPGERIDWHETERHKTT